MKRVLSALISAAMLISVIPNVSAEVDSTNANQYFLNTGTIITDSSGNTLINNENISYSHYMTRMGSYNTARTSTYMQQKTSAVDKLKAEGDNVLNFNATAAERWIPRWDAPLYRTVAKDIAGDQFKYVTYEFDVLFGNENSAVSAAFVDQSSTAARHHVNIKASDSASNMTGSTGTGDITYSDIGVNEWHKVRVVAPIDNNSGNICLYVDDFTIPAAQSAAVTLNGLKFNATIGMAMPVAEGVTTDVYLDNIKLYLGAEPSKTAYAAKATVESTDTSVVTATMNNVVSVYVENEGDTVSAQEIKAALKVNGGEILGIYDSSLTEVTENVSAGNKVILINSDNSLYSYYDIEYIAAHTETSQTLESKVKGMPAAKTVYTDDIFEDRTITDSTSAVTAPGNKKIAATAAKNYEQESGGNKYINLSSAWTTAKSKLTNSKDTDKLTIAFKAANRTSADAASASVQLFGKEHFSVIAYRDSNKIEFKANSGVCPAALLEGKGTAVINDDNTKTYWHDVAVTFYRENGAAYFDEIMLDGEKIEKLNSTIDVHGYEMNTDSNWWTAAAGKNMVELGNSQYAGICFDDIAVYEPISEADISVFRCKELQVLGDLKSGGILTASAAIKNTTAENKPIMLALAVYRQNGGKAALCQVKSSNTTIPAGTSEIKIETDAMSVGELSETDRYYARAYLWSDMTPICTSSPYREDINVVLMGDSICQKYVANYYPQEGWGVYIGNYFDSSYTSVQNKAYGGYTTQTYMDANGWGNEGGWLNIKETLKCGDYIILSLGINDTAININDYKNNLKTIGREAKERGIEVIFVTPIVGARVNDDGRFIRTYGTYADAMIEAANELNCTVLDLSTEMCNSLNARLDGGEDLEKIQGEIFMYYLVQNGILTEEQAAKHPNKNISKYDEITGTYGNDSHLQQRGAEYVAGLIAELLGRSDSSLKTYMK